MDNTKIKELRDLAQKAPKGPWMRGMYGGVYSEVAGYALASASLNGTSCRHYSETENYIAAANPAAVLELIELAERATAAPAESVDTPEFDIALENFAGKWLDWSLTGVGDTSIEYTALISCVTTWGQQRYEAGRQDGIEQTKREDSALILAERARAERAEAALKESGSLETSNVRFAIDGAIQFGREGRNPPPSDDHPLADYWHIGRQLAVLGETGWTGEKLDPPIGLTARIAELEAALASRAAVDLSVIYRYLPWANDDNEVVMILRQNDGVWCKFDDVQALLSGKVEAPTEADDQEFDRQAEALTKAAGLAEGVLNPNATSVLDLYDYPDDAPTASADGLPPLPEPSILYICDLENILGYDDEAMRAYARQALADLADQLAATRAELAVVLQEREAARAALATARADALEEAARLVDDYQADKGTVSFSEISMAIRALNKKGGA